MACGAGACPRRAFRRHEGCAANSGRLPAAAPAGRLSQRIRYKAILFTLISSLLFAAMSSLVRFLGETFPVGQMVFFFRAAFAVIPVLLLLAFRSELSQALRTRRPFGHIGRGFFSVGGMFLNFASLARLPIIDATAISFTSPLITVVFSAVFLKEKVRLYRWSAVIIGFVGVIVMLWQQFDLTRYANIGTVAATATAVGAHLRCCLARRSMRGRLSRRAAPAPTVKPHRRSCSIFR